MEIRTPFPANPLPNVRKQSLTDSDAQRARKEAGEERAKAAQEIRETQQRLEENINELQTQYERKSMNQAARMEAAQEQERNRGYENIRETQRKQQAELMRIKREGEKQLEELKNYYEREAALVERTGEKEVTQIRSKTGTQTALEADAANFALKEARTNDSLKLQRYKEQSDAKLAEEHEAFQTEHERFQANSVVAKEHEEEQFNNKFVDIHTRNKSILERVQSTSDAQIRDLRMNHARRIDAYASRARDPFYQPVAFDARMQEAGDHFMLTAVIPEQERNNVSVVISGNQMVLQVHRRNEEKLEVDPGHRTATNSYQTFRESFPLIAPVDARLLTKYFDGDLLVATVPKSGITARYQPTQAQPERLRVERPRLPDNLVVKARDPELDIEIEDASKEKSRGFRPLGA